MSIPQIPKSVLPHSVVVIEKSGSDANSFTSSTDPKTHIINYVRVEPIDTVGSSSKDGVGINEYVGSYTVFIDAVNSENVDKYQFKEDDSIQFNGESRKVISIAKLYGLSNEIHHWEVTLE